MATFDNEQEKTAGKMSDLVMEYASQFIARDYLESYERVMEDEERFEFVPAEFDDKIYKRIGKLIRKKTGYRFRVFRLVANLVLVLICASCIAFTALVLLTSTLRMEILEMLGIL